MKSLNNSWVKLGEGGVLSHILNELAKLEKETSPHVRRSPLVLTDSQLELLEAALNILSDHLPRKFYGVNIDIALGSLTIVKYLDYDKFKPEDNPFKYTGVGTLTYSLGYVVRIWEKLVSPEKC